MWNQLPGYAVVCTCLLVPLARAEEAITKSVPPVGTIRQVTLYRDSALVTREIAVPPGEPSRTLDVPDLPELMIANSVYADGDESTVVRAVRVSNSPAVESQRQEVRDLDRQLEELKQQRAELQVTLGVIAKNIESLDQLSRFSFAAGQMDLNRGVLNAETLTGLTTFSMNQHRELAGEQLRCQTQLEKVGATASADRSAARASHRNSICDEVRNEDLRGDTPRRCRHRVPELQGRQLRMDAGIHGPRSYLPEDL